jgi:hypothetical protein
MMYKDLYSKASGMADLIQERVTSPDNRTTKAFVDKARQGLVRRRESLLEETTKSNQDGIAELISGYISNMRQANPSEAIEEYIAQTSREKDQTQGSGVWNFEDIGDFAERLAMAESSGRSNVQIQATSGGRQQNMTGLFQFSDGRLTDYMNDTGASFTTEEFRQDPNLQKDVFAWHISDIDRVIRENDLLRQGYNLDGLRAVAHLGGINGMLRYARSGGRHNPSDKFGTSLNDYYNRFSGQ